MAKPDPNQLLEALKTARTEASRSKSAVVKYEKTAKSKAGAIDKLATSSKSKVDALLDDLKTRFTKEGQGLRAAAKTETNTIESIRKEAKSHYNRFSKTYNAATNKRTGVEAKHQRILKLADEASVNANEISKNATKATNTADKITDLLTNSRSKDREITRIHEQAEVVNQEIQNTYAITLDTTMAGTFKERRDDLKKRTVFWEWAYLGSIASIAITILIILMVGKPANFSSVLTDRLVFITPLLLVSFVFSRQFSHERKLYEEYAFKTAAAQSLRGYTVLLNEQYTDERAKRKILDFTIAAMSDIFDREPLIPNLNNFHFSFGNHLGKVEAKLEETIHAAAKEAAKQTVNEVEFAASDESRTAVESQASAT
jgi:hypothetical protein